MKIKTDNHTEVSNTSVSQNSRSQPFLRSLLPCLQLQTSVMIISCALLLTCTSAQPCYITLYQGSTFCKLCFNADESFQSCHFLNPTRPYQQATCRNICCGLRYSDALPPSCYPTPNRSLSSSVSVATILIIVFFSIPVIICVIAILHSCFSNRNRTPIMARARDDPPPSVVNLADYSLDDSFPYHIDTKQSCSICLEENCNIMTLCGHPYHTPCLTAWVRKKHKCPLCVTRDFNPISIYCTKCFRAVKMSLLYKKMKDEERQAWLQDGNLQCESCKNALVPENLDIDMDVQEIERYQNWKKPQPASNLASTAVKAPESLGGSQNKIINDK